MANTYLTRSKSSPTSDKKGTISFWIKRSDTTSEQATIVSGGGSIDSNIFFDTSSRLNVYDYQSGAYTFRYVTNRIFIDPAAWYHIVVRIDTTDGTAGDRVKIYVNGVQETSFSTSTNPSQNLTPLFFTNTYDFWIGSYRGSSGYTNGLYTHFHYTDGYAYDASTFGETDSTSGVWKPKVNPSVTYGTNGFFLKFENSGAMGTDSSGNSNTFAVGGGTLTQNVDTPANNFITINPLDNYYPACTFSNGNTTVATGNNYSYCQSTIYLNKGKWYWEVKAVSKASGADEFMIGIQGKSATGTNSAAQANNGITYYKDGQTYGFGGGGQNYGNSYTVGDIIGVALDCDNNKLYFSKNGTFQNSGVPTSGSTGTGALAITDPNDVPQGGYSPVGGAYTNVSHTLSFNFGSGFFGTTAVASANADANGHGAMEYAVPSGYYTLNTKNIKEFG